MQVGALAALAVLALAVPGGAVRTLRRGPVSAKPNITSAAEVMRLAPKQFVEVTLGPFGSAAAACDYCAASFTKQGDPPAGPVAPYCICMAYPHEGVHNMMCATPPSASKYIAEKN